MSGWAPSLGDPSKSSEKLLHTEDMDPIEAAIDWDVLHERMDSCPWSPAARTAGLWAIDVLREELGPRWPRAWRAPENTPPELARSARLLAAYVGTVELALALRRIRAVPGARTIRDTIRSTARYDALMSPRLQMRIATVALAGSIEVGIEPTMPDAQTPADLLLTHAGVSCTVELLAVMRDAKTLDADRWLKTISDRLRRIGQRHNVEFRGRIQTPLDQQHTTELLDEIERHAGAAAQGLEPPEIQIEGVAVTTVRSIRGGGGTSFDLPRIDYAKRILDKLGDKAEQAQRSAANWILADWADHLWHMTAWAAQTLEEKGNALAALIRSGLDTDQHIQGVVITDGAVLMRPDVAEQTVQLPEGAIAISRQIDSWHTRESVIIPLQPQATEGAQLWLKILDGERNWVARELAIHRLEPPRELAKT
jgi:hypothetical protein